jgi:hypothetical protein
MILRVDASVFNYPPFVLGHSWADPEALGINYFA